MRCHIECGAYILPNVKFTRGDETPDKRLKFQFLETVIKPDMSATSRRVQRLVLLLIFQVSLNEIDFLVIIIIDVIRLTISGTFLSVIQG